MTPNLLRITHQDDKIQLSWQRGQSAPRSTPPITFEHPFDKETLTSLRWYLEEFLPFPYGIFPDKAKKLEQKFQEWGQQLFDLVFPRTTKAWDFFCEATREGLDKCEINISSDDPMVLNLPWELLYSPDYQFLAPSVAGMYRSLSGYALRAPIEQLPQDKLNILLVISRPYSEKDVALKTIARPMLEALKPIKKHVNLKVLRPPSFEEFERELNTHKGFYHIVHFDGHGDFDQNSAGFQYSFGSKGQGVLIFENIDGSPQIITAAQIAQSLNNCRVPIFVLNACKSAQSGEGSFSSVATRLVSLGAKGVVAMSYNVQVQAAKHFIERFYQQLVLGTNISTAVASARLQVLNQRLRPCPKDDLPLADWMVPVLYQQETYTPFLQQSTASNTPNIDDFLDEPNSNLVGFPERERYGFIGRDYDILRLERAFRQNNIVLLQGMGGVGKTELTAGFAQWLEETQGREHLFFISFESGASLSRVVNEVGRAVWKDKFSQYTAQQQQKAVLNFLKQKPCLLIWDNFEPVAGFPEGNDPLLSADERNDLKQFLNSLRGGQTWVLITSRREEAWLDCNYTLINLQGFNGADAQEYAAKILQTAGVDRKNLQEEYLDLLKLLDGHPLSLRVILPHLKTQVPSQLIEALRQGLNNLEKKTELGKDKSLTASLDYSFSNLSEKARRHLPFLGLFCDKINTILLGFFSDVQEESGQIYESMFGEKLQKSDWQKILNEATTAGILQYIGDTIYKIHPILPSYMRLRLAENYSGDIINLLETKLLIFYGKISAYLNQEFINNAEHAAFMMESEEANILRYLRLAEQYQDWLSTRFIMESLVTWYFRIGYHKELRVLQKRVINALNLFLKNTTVKEEFAFDLWMNLRAIDAHEAFDNNDLVKAFEVNQEVLNEITAFEMLVPSYRKSKANVYHNLGVITQNQRKFQEAHTFYLEALQIREDVGDNHGKASIYNQLARLAQLQNKFEDAKSFYLKALQIREDIGDEYYAANLYRNI